MSQVVYRYAWGNNSRRAALKGRLCVIETTGGKQTALVRFLDSGERVTTSIRALRAVEQDGEVLVTTRKPCGV